MDGTSTSPRGGQTMTWELSPGVHLRNDRVRPEDADRQERTAAEILRRLDDQTGRRARRRGRHGEDLRRTRRGRVGARGHRRSATRRRHGPACGGRKVADRMGRVRRAVPAARPRIQPPGPSGVGASSSSSSTTRPATRKHLIFLTHGALTTNLNDPFIRLAFLRRRQRRPDLARRRRAIARPLETLLNDRRFDPDTVEALFDAPSRQWRAVWKVPTQATRWTTTLCPSLPRALEELDLDPLRDALLQVPVHNNASLPQLACSARRQLTRPSTRRGPRASANWTTCTFRSSCSTRRTTSRTRTSSPAVRQRRGRAGRRGAAGPLGNVFEQDAVPDGHAHSSSATTS